MDRQTLDYKIGMIVMQWEARTGTRLPEAPWLRDEIVGLMNDVTKENKGDASPELLAALEAALAWVSCAPRKDQMEEYAAARGRVIAAIAKAKGE